MGSDQSLPNAAEISFKCYFVSHMNGGDIQFIRIIKLPKTESASYKLLKGELNETARIFGGSLAGPVPIYWLDGEDQITVLNNDDLDILISQQTEPIKKIYVWCTKCDVK